MSHDATVIVIGAGLSGLTAADRLAAAGVDVVVVEANDRVGGRTWSAPYGNAVFDRGGQWIGPSQRRMHALVAELGLQLHPTFNEGRKVMELGGRRLSYRGDIPSASWLQLIELQIAMMRLQRLANRLDPGSPFAADEATAWDGLSLEAWKRQHIRGRDTRAMLDIAVRSVFSSEPAELSFLYFLTYLRSAGSLEALISVEGGGQQDRVVGGAQQISERLADRVGHDRLRLRNPVRRVVHDGEGVTVETDTSTLRAAHVVIAMAPAMAGRLRYHPLLPMVRDQLHQRSPMGATIKCLALYDRAFWREDGHSGETYSNDGPVVFTYDNSSHDGAQPALVGFVVGRHARELAGLPPGVRRTKVLDALAERIGPEARHPTEYAETNWNQQPWAGGCPVSVGTPGSVTGCWPAMRAPVGRLHWAGTETATVWMGFMEGAVESGERVADEVLAELS